eukprot:139067_1
MKHILPFLALLWAVAADDELVGGGDVPSKLQARELGKNKKFSCTQKTGLVCIKDPKGDFQVKVSGDYHWFCKRDKATQKKCQGYTRTISIGDKKTITFCGKIDAMVHQLVAPRIAKSFILNTGYYKKGYCDKWDLTPEHEVWMELETSTRSVGNDDSDESGKSGKKQNEGGTGKKRRKKRMKENKENGPFD